MKSTRKKTDATPLPPLKMPDDECYTVTMTVTDNRFKPVPPPDVIVLKWWQFTPDGYYRQPTWCCNCDMVGRVAVRRGLSVTDAEKNHKCPNCGC